MQNASYQSVRVYALFGYAEKATRLSRLPRICSDPLQFHPQNQLHTELIYLALLNIELEQLGRNTCQYLLPFILREG